MVNLLFLLQQFGSQLFKEREGYYEFSNMLSNLIFKRLK
jgi:hypothetical protein